MQTHHRVIQDVKGGEIFSRVNICLISTDYHPCLNERKLSVATCPKQVAFCLNTKEGLFLGPRGLSGF